MGFVKVQKDKAYFKRYQVKYRRRREGKTDYYARKKLIVQAKNKYNTPKYRLAVRFTNRFCIVQVISAELTGDRTIVQANSKELSRYGVKAGFKNYPAAYCTGLLAARRLLATKSVKIGGEMKTLGEIYTGNKIDEEAETGGEIVSCENDGRTFFVDEEQLNDEARPFRCYLDVGLRRTTSGCRIWGALKGAVDGGLDIPHNEKRFPGYDAESKDYDPAEHRERILGEPIAEYMRNLNDPEWCADDDHSYQHPDDFERIFGAYIKAEVDGDDVCEMYTGAHDAIRADPSAKHAESAKVRAAPHAGRKAEWKKGIKHTAEEKQANLQAKIDAAQEESEEEEDDEEDDE